MQIERALAPRIGIVADDLTSAADGASPFVERGLPAFVGLGNCPQLSADVISMDTESRNLDEAGAWEVTRDATLALCHAELLYKTIDSTLRGNIEIEIAAAFKNSQRGRLVIAPAFPEAGRTTSNGVQLVNGVPVAQTVYSNDPVHPAKTSRVADLVDCIAADIVVLDADTQDDLNQQVAAIPDKRDVLWVGSPGIAKALAACISGHDRSPVLPPTVSSVLVVVGSANPISQNQAQRLHGLRAVKCLCAPNTNFRKSSSVLKTLIDDAEREIRTGQYDAVIATGGETMHALLQRIDVNKFSLDCELEPGFPLGKAICKSGLKALFVAMKAGGFGGSNTLRNAVMRLLGLTILEVERN